MLTTTSYEFGDLVLVPFPFADQTTTKQRPAVVVSSAEYSRERDDVLLLAITSQRRASLSSLDPAVQHWKQAGLIKPSVFKPLIATIERRLVIKKLGGLHVDDCSCLSSLLDRMLGG